MREVRSIPAAPRRVRFGPMLAHRWPLGLIGAVMAGFGGLLSWMLFLAAGAKPSDQHRLDRGPTVLAPGTVLEIDPQWIRAPDGKRWQWVDYDFRYDGRRIEGKSMARFGMLAVDAMVDVELLPDEPNRNRIVGTMLHFDRAWLLPESWLGVVVIPGALLLLGWLAGVFHLRHVLVHGDVSTGKVLAVEPVRFWLPEMLRLKFEFRDHRAVLRRGGHWVRAHSELGAQIQHQAHTGWFDPLPVLHDRRFPQWNRMVLAKDFLQSPPPHEPLEPVG